MSVFAGIERIAAVVFCDEVGGAADQALATILTIDTPANGPTLRVLGETHRDSPAHIAARVRDCFPVCSTTAGLRRLRAEGGPKPGYALTALLEDVSDPPFPNLLTILRESPLSNLYGTDVPDPPQAMEAVIDLLEAFLAIEYNRKLFSPSGGALDRPTPHHERWMTLVTHRIPDTPNGATLKEMLRARRARPEDILRLALGRWPFPGIDAPARLPGPEIRIHLTAPKASDRVADPDDPQDDGAWLGLAWTSECMHVNAADLVSCKDPARAVQRTIETLVHELVHLRAMLGEWWDDSTKGLAAVFSQRVGALTAPPSARYPAHYNEIQAMVGSALLLGGATWGQLPSTRLETIAALTSCGLSSPDVLSPEDRDSAAWRDATTRYAASPASSSDARWLGKLLDADAPETAAALRRDGFLIAWADVLEALCDRRGRGRFGLGEPPADLQDVLHVLAGDVPTWPRERLEAAICRTAMITRRSQVNTHGAIRAIRDGARRSAWRPVLRAAAADPEVATLLVSAGGLDIRAGGWPGIWLWGVGRRAINRIRSNTAPSTPAMAPLTASAPCRHDPP